MDNQLDQVVHAIAVASDASQANLHPEALRFLKTIESDHANAWKLGLTLFTTANADGSRKYSPHARFFGLRAIEGFLEERFEPLDDDSFQLLRKELLDYIRSEYLVGQAELSASFVRNKFSHILTLFFLCTYLEQWPTFFSDLFTLILPQDTQSTSDAPDFNLHVSLLLFRLILEISGEVADQTLKSARSFNPARHARDGKVRDAVRARDAAGINEAVLAIVASGVKKLGQARKGEITAPVDQLTEVVDWGIRSYGSYVGWIDINLTVTPTTIPLLFSMLSDPSQPIRLATSGSLTRLVTKGLKEPTDKLQLFRVLSLGQVLAALEEKTRQEQQQRGEDIDEEEEAYREALARLLNYLGLELAKLLEEAADREDIRAEAVRQLDELRPTTLHFLADPFDDTCATIFPLLSTILSTLKKARRSSQESLPEPTRSFLSTALNTILQKMKWDSDKDPDDMDEDDKRDFKTFRGGDLRVHLDSISVIEPAMVLDTVQTFIMSTFSKYQAGTPVAWNEAELAIYLVYIFGDINKSGGKGRAAFCHAPAVAKEARKKTDYADYPLTTHGELLFTMVRCGIANYPHNAVSMQFFETCARYGDFFKVRKECIIPLLQAMVGPRGVHHSDVSSRSRVYYLFNKFLKEDRNEISPELALSLLAEFRDALTIQVELPVLESTEQDLLAEAVANSETFESQLYLFETSGMLISLNFKKPEESENLLQGIVQPLLAELSNALRQISSPQDVVHILKVHHVIRALGSIAKGFPEFPSPLPPDYIPPPIETFRQMTQAIIVSLEAMNVFKVVREAVRFAFGRIITTAGKHVIEFIPSLMSNLLAQFEPSELSEFLVFIGLFMHRLRKDIFEVVDQLIGPLHVRIVELLSTPVTGTDDKLTHTETKKSYLSFLSNVISNGLSGVFLSEANKTSLEGILGYVLQVAEDSSDPASQRLAVAFLSKCVDVWAREDKQEAQVTNGVAPVSNGNSAPPRLPGFERFVYERIVPVALRVPSSPNFNIKDGQMLVVLHEISMMLKAIFFARGREFPEFLASVFFPSLGWPSDTAADFASKVADLDQKNFKKYFTDFVRASKQASNA